MPIFSAEPPDPTAVFLLGFAQHKVKVSGRNLETLLRLVFQHRVAEFHEAERSKTFDISPKMPLAERIEVQAKGQAGSS